MPPRPSGSRPHRPVSAGSLKDLYGVPVCQIRSSEDAFRKESYKRDMQRLKMAVEAINAEKRHAERKWDICKSRFARQHALQVPRARRQRVVYHKVATLRSQPEEVIPPCIPFVGAFPPSRHPTKERRVSEMFKEPLFSRGTFPELDDVSCVDDGEVEPGKVKEDTAQDNYSYFLANYRVSHSFGPPAVADNGSSVAESSCGKGPRKTSGCSVTPSRISTVNEGKFQTKSASSSAKLSVLSKSNTSDVRLRQKNVSGSVDSSGTTKRNVKQKQENASFSKTRNGFTDHKVANHHTAGNKSTGINVNRTQTMDNGYYNGRSTGSEVNNNLYNLPTKGADPDIQRNEGSQFKMLNDQRGLMNKNTAQLQGGTKNSTHSQATTPSKQKNQRIVASKEQVNPRTGEKKVRDDNPERETQEKSSAGDSPGRRSDMASTPDSLDVDLLQKALVDHATQSLSRSRWQRTAQLVRSHSIPGDEVPHLLLSPPGSLHGSTLSLASVSTPTTRSATDASEIPRDGSMAVVRIIMQLFRELDQRQLGNLRDVWPRKMEKMMSTIEELVRQTGVEVTEIVEKIQRGDIQDEKSAALLDWVGSIDDAAAVYVQGENGPTLPQHASHAPSLGVNLNANRSRARSGSFKDVNGNLTSAEHSKTEWTRAGRSSSAVSLGAASSHRPPLPKPARKEDPPPVPVIVLPPGRRMSSDVEANRGHRQGISTHTQLSTIPIKTRSSLLGERRKSGSPPSESFFPCTSNDAAIFYQRRRVSISRARSASSDSRSEIVASDSKLLSVSPFCSHAVASRNEVEVIEERSSTKLPDYSPPALLHPSSDVPENKPSKQRESLQKSAEHFLPSVQRSPPLVVVTEDGDQPVAKNSATLSAGTLTSCSKLPDSSSQVQAGAGTENCNYSSSDNLQTKGVRSVSFSSTSRLDLSSGPSPGGDREDRLRKELQNTDRRTSRASSFSHTVSTDSQNSHPHSMRPRVSSMGQQATATRGAGKPVGRHSTPATRGRSLSPSSALRGAEVSWGQRQRLLAASPQSHKVAFEDVAEPKEQQETTETFLHKDRRGRMHRLTMRKVSLSHTHTNVILTREDTVQEQDTTLNHTESEEASNSPEAQNDGDASTKEPKTRETTTHDDPVPSIASNKDDTSPTPTPHPRITSSDGDPIPSTAYNKDTSPTPHPRFSSSEDDPIPSTAYNKDDASPTPTPHPRLSSEDDPIPSTASNKDDTSPTAAPHRRLSPLDKSETRNEDDLWRKRLAHPRHMSWVQELTTDHRAQGLALSLLLRKEGGGARFRSMALNIICINALRAAKNAYEDSKYSEMKRCRYLRMPEDYLPELDLSDIFA